MEKWVQEKPDECPVCLDEFDDEEEPLECGHWIHIECIKKSRRNRCPMCRKHLNIHVNAYDSYSDESDSNDNHGSYDSSDDESYIVGEITVRDGIITNITHRRTMSDLSNEEWSQQFEEQRERQRELARAQRELARERELERIRNLPSPSRYYSPPRDRDSFRGGEPLLGRFAMQQADILRSNYGLF